MRFSGAAFFGLVFFALLFFHQPACAQNANPSAPTPSPKAARFHQALLKRPNSDTLFSRFFDAWLESNSMAELETFLTRDPEPAAAEALIRGRFFLRRGEEEKARGAFESATQDEEAGKGLKAQALLALSDSLTRDLDFAGALDRLIAASQVAPDQHFANDLEKRRGKLLLRLDRRGEALEVWRGLLEKHPDDVFLREDVVRLLAHEGLFDEAIAQQRALIDRAEEKKDVYAAVLGKMELGQIFRRSNNWREATRVWRETLPATGHDTWIEREILGLVETSYRRSDNLTGLKSALQEMIEAEPKRLALQIAQAQLLADLREDAAALAQWKHILSLTPGDRELRLKFVRTLANLERPAEAAQALRDLIEIQPEDEELHFELADLEFISEQLDRCAASLLAFLEKSDGSEFSFLRAARQLARYDLNAPAEKVFRDLIAKFPESAGASDAYAVFLYDTERRGEAVDRWKKIASNGDVRQVLQVSRQLAARFESAADLEVLQSRLDDFSSESSYLKEICRAALIEKETQSAFQWARRRVDLAETAPELDDAASQALRVAARLDEEHFQTALDALQSAGGIRPSCLHALLLDSRGDTEAAVSALQNLAGDGTAADALFPLLTLTRVHRTRESWSDAADAMKQIVTKTPGGRTSNHLQELVSLRERAFQPDQALHWTREWKRISPGSPRPWLRESELLEQAGRISEALRVIQDAGRRFEKETDIQIRLARMYSEAGYPLEAERVVWKLYEQTDDTWLRQSWIGDLTELAQKSGRLEELIAQLEERRRSNSQSLDPILSLAEVYRLTQKTNEHRETLLAASALARDDVHLAHRIVDLDLQHGKYNEALRRLESVRDSDKTGRTINRLARLYMISGHFDKALAMVAELPGGKKPSVDEIKTMALSAMSLGEWESAAQFLEDRLTDHPDVAELAFLHALALVQTRSQERARSALLNLFRFKISQPAPASAGGWVSSHSSYLQSPVQKVSRFQSWQQVYPYTLNSIRQSLTPFGQLHRVYHFYQGNGNWSWTTPVSDTQFKATVFSLLQLIDSEADLENPAFRQELLAAGLSPVELDCSRFLHAKDQETKDQIADDLLKRYGNDLSVLNWYLRSLNGIENQPEARQKLVRGVIKKVRDDHGVDRAASSALTCGAVDLAFELLPEVEKISDDILQLLLQVNAELSVEQEKERDAALARWEFSGRPKVNQPTHLYASAVNNKQRLWFYLLQHYARAEKVDPWLRRVRQLFEPAGSNVASPGLHPNLANQYLREGNDPVLPNHVPGLFLSPLVHSSYRLSAVPRNLGDHLESTASNPAIYYVLSRLAEHDGHIKKSLAMLEKAAAKDDASLPVLFLLAHWLHHEQNKQRDPARASEFFQRARYLPLEPIDAMTIDFYLVQAAASSEPDSPLQKRGLLAIQRLRQDPNLDQYQWSQISSHLAAWGMPEKVKRPARIEAMARQRQMRAAYLGGFGGWRSRHHYHYGGNLFIRRGGLRGSIRGLGSHLSYSPFTLPDLNSLNQSARRLIDAKQTDAVVFMLARQLPLQATRILSVQGEHPKSQFRYLRESLDKANLTVRVIEACRPPKEARRLDRARYAALCEALGKSEPAAVIYRQLAEEDAADPIPQMRLILTFAEKDPQKAMDELQTLSAKLEPAARKKFVGPVLDAIAQRNQQNLSDTIKIAEAFVSFLDEVDLPESPSPPLHSYSGFGLSYRGSTGLYTGPGRILQMLNQNRREGKVRIPQLIQQHVAISSVSDPFGFGFSGGRVDLASGKEAESKYPELLKNRAEVYEKLTRQLIDRVRLGNRPNHFKNLVLLHEAQETESAALLPVAQKIAAGFVADEASSLAIDMDVNAPVPWLIEHAFRSGDRTLLEPWQDHPRFAAARKLERLYFCEPEEFAGIVREGDTNLPNQWRYMQKIRRLRTEVGEHFDAAEFALAGLKLEPRSNAYAVVNGAVGEFAQTKSHAELRDFLDEIAAILFFPEGAAEDSTGYSPASNRVQSIEEQGKPKAKMDLSRHYENRRLSTEANFFISLVNKFGSLPQTSFFAYQYAKDRGLGVSQNLNRNPEPFGNSYRGENGKKSFLTFLKASPIAVELADFDTLSFQHFPHFQNRDQRNHSLVAKWIALLKASYRSSNDKSIRESLRKIVAPEGDEHKFGARLVAAAFDDKPDEALLLLFHEKIVDIQNLPEEKESDICQLARDVIDLSRLRRSLTREERDVLTAIGRSSSGQDERIIEKWGASKSLTEAGIDFRNREVRFDYNIFQRFMIYDWERTFAAFENICALGEAGVANGLLQPQGETFTDRFFERALPYHLPAESFAFVLARANSKRLPPLFEVQNFTDRIEDRINKADAGKPDLRRHILSEIFADIAGQIDLAEVDIRVTLPILSELVDDIRGNYWEDLLQWTKSNEARLLHPELARYAQAALALHLETRDKPLPAEEVDFFKKILQPKTKTNPQDKGIRLMIARQLCGELSSAPPELLRLSLLALADGWLVDSPKPVRSTATILYAYQRYKSGGQPGWEDVDRALSDAFHRRYVAAEPLHSKGRFSSHTSNRSREIDGRTLHYMIDIQTSCDHFAAANQILTRFPDKLKKEWSDIFVTLVRNGAHEMAAKMLRTRWRDIIADPPDHSKFDDVQGRALQTFVENLQGEEKWVPVFANLIIGGMRNSTLKGVEVSEEWGDHTSRLVEVAKGFKDSDFPVIEMRNAVLSGLFDVSEASVYIEPHMVQFASDWTVPMLAREKDSRILDRQLNMFAAMLSGELVEGKTARWETAFRESGAISSKSTRDKFARSLETALSRASQKQDLSPAAALNLLGSLYLMIEGDRIKVGRNTVTNLMVLHYLSATATKADVRKRFSSLSPGARKRFVPEYRDELTRALFDAEKRLQDNAMKLSLMRDALGVDPGIFFKHQKVKQPDSFLVNVGRSKIGVLSREQIQGPFGFASAMLDVLLTSQTVDDTGMNPSWFRQETSRMLNQASDLRTRRRVFDQSAKMIRQKQSSEKGWHYSYWNGWSPSSKSLTDYGSDSQKKDWTPLALLTDVLWRDTPRDFTYAHSHEYDEQNRFYRILYQNAGLWRPKPFLGEMFESLGRELGNPSTWGSASVLLPQFFESFEGVGNPVYMIDFIRAAEEIFSESENPFAREFAMAGRICLTAYHHEYFGTDPIPEPDAWRAHAVNVLKDQETHIAARLCLARFFTNRLRGKLNDEILRAAAEVVAEGLNSEQFVSGYVVSNVLRSYNQMEPDEPWREISRKLIVGWWRKCHHDAEDPKFGRAYRAVTETVLAVLETMLKLEDNQGVARLLTEKTERLEKSPRAFALLVKYGHHEEAAKFFRDHSTDWDVKEYEGRYDLRHDRVLAEQIPVFLNTLDQPEEKFFAGLFLQSLPDPLPEDDHWLQLHPVLRERLGIGELKPRAERLAPLTKKMPEAGESRLRAVKLFCREWRVAEHLESELTHQWDKRKIGGNIPSGTKVEDELLLYTIHAVHEILCGDAEPFTKLLKEISTYRASYTQRDGLGFALRTLNEVAKAELRHADEKQLSAFQQGYAAAFQYSLKLERNLETSNAVFLQLIAGALLDGGKSLPATRKGAGPSQMKFAMGDNLITAPHVIAEVCGVEGHGEPGLSEEKIWQIVKTFIGDEWIRDRYKDKTKGHLPWLAHLIQHRCLTPERIEKSADEIVERWEVSDLASMELAEYFARKGDRKRAGEFARKALKSTSFNGIAARVRLAAVFRDLGDRAFVEEALETAEGGITKIPEPWAALHQETLSWLEDENQNR